MNTNRDDKHNPSDVSSDTAENRDPITGSPGAHPVGAGLGAAGGGAAGAALGAIAGPVGAVVGAAVGGIAGGLLGKGVAEGINPTAEHEYWSENFTTRPYVEEPTAYAMYGPAYQYGWESYLAHKDRNASFEDVEDELSRKWEANRGASDLTWERARHAARDAWERLGKQRPDRRP